LLFVGRKDESPYALAKAISTTTISGASLKVFDDDLSLFDDKKLDVGGFFATSEDLSRPDAGLIGLRPYASLVYHQLSVFSS